MIHSCWMLVRTLLLFASVLCVTGLECSDEEIVYRECSCLSIHPTGRTFDEALNTCTSKQGMLLEIADEADFTWLMRYLEGVREVRKLWIGYRYDASGARTTVEGGVAPSVILDDSNFGSGSNVSGSSTCIAVSGGRFFNTPCSDEHPFLCQYSYTVPQVTLSPASNVVYIKNSTSTILSADIASGNVTGVEWRRDGTILTPDQSRLNSSVGVVTASIDSIQTGTYNLVVTVRSGTFVVAAWLVRQAVVGWISSPPANLTVAPTQLAGFQCGVSNFTPPYQFTWFKDSTQLMTAGSSRLLIVQETGSLYIREVTVTDAGTYQCMVSNEAGSVRSEEARLMVTEELGNFGVKYAFYPSNILIIAGQSLVYDILGQTTSLGETATEVSFIYDPDKRYSLDKYKYPTNPSFPVFTFTNISSDFDGRTIRAIYHNSPNPQAIAAEFEVITVIAVANVAELRTSWNGIESSDSLRSVSAGSTVSLFCRLSGKPSPTMEWYRDGVQIEEGVVTDGSQSTLTVSNVESSHTYQCLATNDYGTDIASVIIFSQPSAQVPGPVTFQVEPNSNTSLYVSWNEVEFQGVPELLRYDIQYQSMPGGVVRTQLELFDVRSVVLAGLQSNTDYEVTMSASSLSGSGPSATKTISTFANAPTVAIPASSVNVSYFVDGSTLAVRWSPYLDSNQRLLAAATYELQYQKSGQDKEGDTQMTTVSGESSVAVINGLSDSKNYEVRIRVVVQIQRSPPMFSEGPWSDYIKATMEIPGSSTAESLTVGVAAPRERVPQKVIIIIVAALAAVVLMGVVITAIFCCVCCYRRRGGVYSIPAAEHKKSKSIVSFDYSSNVTSTFSPSSPIASSQAPPTSPHMANRENLIDPSSKSKSSDLKVTIAVVDTNSIDGTKKPLSNSDSWTEEFDQLEGLVNTLKDTVTSMASLPQASPSPDPLPPPKTIPPSVGLSTLTAGVLVIDNPDAGSQGTVDIPDGVHLDDSIDEHVIENTLSNEDDTQKNNNDSSSSEEEEEESGSSQFIQAGTAKREDNFVPQIYGDKVLYPLQVPDGSTSSSSSLDSTGNKRKKSLRSSPTEGEEIRANFIELLQYGDKSDLHLV